MIVGDLPTRDLTCECGTTIPVRPPPAAASFTGTRTVEDLERGAAAIRREAYAIRRGRGDGER